VLYDRLIVGLTLASRLSGQSGPSPSPPAVELGRLRLRLEPQEARSICVDGEEIVRRLFFAVRDVDWGTAATTILKSSVERDSTRVTAAVAAVSADPDSRIDFTWAGTITGTAEGEVGFTVSGTARSPFDYARIGLCVLHPPEFAGGRYRARTSTGWIEGDLLREITPQAPGPHGFGVPPFPAFNELELFRADGFGVRLELEGDLFEFEDQRNWTDASYKTYSTPLELGPRHAHAGLQIRQRVHISPIGSRRARRRDSTPASTLEIGAPLLFTLPEIGVGAGNGDELTEREAALLRELDLAHVRYDLQLGADELDEQVERMAAQTEAIASGLELALTLAGTPQTLDVFAQRLGARGLRLVRTVVFREDAAVTPAADVAAVRTALRAAGIPSPVFGGTDRLFADLNGQRPEIEGFDGIAYPLCPTVHADDDLSLVETMAIHGETVQTARTFAGALPIAVTPLTLRERPGHDRAVGARAVAQPDVRQAALLGAVWTLGTAASLARAGAESLTYYEAVGPRGVLEADEVFPLYHVLADLCEWRGSRVCSTTASRPLAVDALAVRDLTGSVHALIANVQPEPTQVVVRGLPPGSRSVRRLHEDSFDAACFDPRGYRAGRVVEPIDMLELDPYEVIRVDVGP
jgi:hypothetical protein